MKSNQEIARDVADKITNELKNLVKTERKITRQILEKINEAEDNQTHAKLGHGDIKEYLIKEIGYSETAAQRRLNAARALRAVPEIGNKIENGLLNLTTVSQVQSAIGQQERRTGEKFNKAERVFLLTEAESSTARQVEEKLAARFPENAKPDFTRIINEDQVRVNITITKAQLANLERAREIMSHTHAGASLGEVIDFMTGEFLKRRDPLMREVKPRAKSETKTKFAMKSETKTESTPAKQRVLFSPSGKKLVAAIPESLSYGKSAETPTTNVTQSKTAPVFSPEEESQVAQVEQQAHASEHMRGKQDPYRSALERKRKAIPPSVRNYVFRRDQGKCQFTDPVTKRKCESRHFAEVDHVISWALGGSDEPENLQVLCGTHNLLKAERDFGKAKIAPYRRC